MWTTVTTLSTSYAHVDNQAISDVSTVFHKSTCPTSIMTEIIKTK